MLNFIKNTDYSNMVFYLLLSVQDYCLSVFVYI